MKKQKPEQKPRKIYTPVSKKDPKIQEYINSDDSAKVNKLISMAYLVSTIANAYAEEAVEILEKYALVQKKFKTKVYNLHAAFDAFDKEMFKMINCEEGKKAFCLDYDIVRKLLDDYMAIENYKEVQEKYGLGNGY